MRQGVVEFPPAKNRGTDEARSQYLCQCSFFEPEGVIRHLERKGLNAAAWPLEQPPHDHPQN